MNYYLVLNGRKPTKEEIDSVCRGRAEIPDFVNRAGLKMIFWDHGYGGMNSFDNNTSVEMSDIIRIFKLVPVGRPKVGGI